MDQEDFYTAKVVESDGWEFLGTTDGGDMMFSRLIGGVVYNAMIRKDR